MSPGDGFSNGIGGTGTSNTGTSNTNNHTTTSNIRVFVRWHEQVVFAGEEVKCTITFKNVARTATTPSTPTITATLKPLTSSRLPNSERGPRQSSPLAPAGQQARTKANSGLAPPSAGRGHHRSSLSLSVPSAASRARSGSIQGPWSPPPSSPAPQRNGNGQGHSHKRSVSIVSIGSSVGNIADDGQGSTSPGKPSRAGRGHARASSLQIVPRGGIFNGPRSATTPRLPTSQSSPLFHASYPPERSINGLRTGTPTTPNTPKVGCPRVSPTAEPGPSPLAEFKFPMTQSPSTPGTAGIKPEDDSLSPTNSPWSPIALPVRSREQVPTINEHGATPTARILSTTSIAGTPRSSGEFYSLSNNSSETLASEYVLHQPLRSQARPPHSRRTSSLAPSTTRLPESLMMGYAQIQGSFTLDGSLVNLGPFEAVKRKAVVGGQGGGVIGLDTTTTKKRDSGLLRSFGWGSITSSIGELLGGGELSSIKEMRGIASSKSIPLLSTPQSILFVDLQLAPGESKAFEYTFKLPKGLPPTHRGKLMKISYSLVIGTQRPGGAKEQRIKSVDVPFRVLGSVNSHGEILGHDLMSPYILLRDQAIVKPASNNTPSSKPKPSSSQQQQQQQQPAAANTFTSFLTYVDDLLAQEKNNPTAGLLSPTAIGPSSRRPSTYSLASDHTSHNPFFLTPPTAKEAIDLAILRSNLTSNSAANRFEIARNGRRIGVIMLARPAYRLGEVITLAIDFAGAEVPCYAVHAALETSEKVDASLALRSEASVQRVTRKVWVSHSETSLYARRIVFAPTIPVNATPEFVTSGVGLEWKVRVEFVVGLQGNQSSGMQRRLENVEEDDGEEEREEEEEEEEQEGDVGVVGGVASGEATGLVKQKEKEKEKQQQRQQYQDERRGSSRSLESGSGFGMQREREREHPLLEEISRDDRGGLVMVAVENLTCESFEVAVPLRVYGAVCNGLERLERDEALEEGLVV
ncbi:Rgp1-domain-containing protein [Podospora fimiseda]|uniref:Rgp1-domain-containing protein n=1 Tax=Podospora fimiseda TaxID=252190 RepID=A0AAN7BRC6_9PEZI|nr:Rgp1-domain-containing protein [Podospora fimiseda]